MSGIDASTPHRVTYDRLLVFDHQPRDNQYIYFVKASDAECIKKAIEELVLSQVVRKKTRELPIWEPPHRHNVLAKIETEATDKEARRAQSILLDRFNAVARKHGKETALKTVIEEYPARVRHGVDYCLKWETPTTNRRVDRTNYVQTATSEAETGTEMTRESSKVQKKATKVSR